jgi:hypothetical protein
VWNEITLQGTLKMDSGSFIYGLLHAVYSPAEVFKWNNLSFVCCLLWVSLLIFTTMVGVKKEI